jgi:hypothetical protein
MLNLLLATAAVAALHQSPDPVARAVLDTAVARMGGIAALRAVQRVKVESVTEWQRTMLDDRPNAWVSSYEWSTELRDYVRPAWRYTRRFIGANGINEIIDLVTDSVAAVRVRGAWQTQNIAYVDERTELFTFTPERLMLLASDAGTLRALGDTTINAVRYARVRATVDGFDVALHFSRRDGGLALAAFRHAQLRDFGLAPWGKMDVAIWYSRWQRLAPNNPLTVPTQLDIYRVGKPYQRITVLGVQVNPAIPADSLAMPDSLRAAFLAEGGKAMWDLPMDSAKIVSERFAVFGTSGAPSGAVKLGGKWLMIGGGAVPALTDRSAAFLSRADASAPLAGAIVMPPGAPGGIAWLAEHHLPVWVTTGARPYAAAAMYGWNVKGSLADATAGSWLRVGTDSVRVESIAIPDYPAVGVLFVPSLRWMYVSNPGALEDAAALARRRGWTVERVGSARDFAGVPASR